MIAAHRAQLAGDGDDLALLAACDLSTKGTGECKWCNRIDLECLQPACSIGQATIGDARAFYTRIRDQDVDSLVSKRAGEFSQLPQIGNVKRMNRHGWSQRVQPLCLLRRTDRRDHAPSVECILATEFETEATARAGDE